MCLINGDIPANWYFEPEKINCIHGYGMQEDKLKNSFSATLKSMVLKLCFGTQSGA